MVAAADEAIAHSYSTIAYQKITPQKETENVETTNWSITLREPPDGDSIKKQNIYFGGTYLWGG